MAFDYPTSRTGRHGGNQERVSRDVPQIPEHPNVPEETESDYTDGDPERMVVWTYRDGQIEEIVAGLSRSLSEGIEQVVVWLPRRECGCYRGMESEERMHSFVPQDLGGSLPVYSTDQGRESEEDTPMQDYSSE